MVTDFHALSRPYALFQFSPCEQAEHEVETLAFLMEEARGKDSHGCYNSRLTLPQPASE